ncbi:MAG: Peptide deformylase 1 [Phycisphaerae bacterium]|nr:Peptide deformylase 1 [Phycisphaerae bacterium]
MPTPPDNPETLEIIIYPHPSLREVASPVQDPSDPRIFALVSRMRQLMLADNGVGLAATQVNVPLRIFIASPTHEAADEIVAINPQIVEEEGWQETKEGCLSIPEVTCSLRRRQRVRLKYLDLAGAEHVVDVRDFLATICQHENDHLDGRLIIDRVGPIGKLSIRDQIRRLEETFEQAAASTGK